MVEFSGKSEDELIFLFAPFRAEHLNPVGYRKKMDFWMSTIESVCADQGSFVTTASELSRRLGRSDGTEPKCLDEVLTEMNALGKLRPPDALLKAPSWSSWLASWVWSAPRKAPVGPFLVASALDATAERLVERVRSRGGQALLADVWPVCVKDDRDRQTLLRALAGRLFIQDGWVSTESLDEKRLAQLQLSRVQRLIDERSRALSTDRDAAREEARRCVRDGGRRDDAKRALRRARRADGRLAQLEATRDRLVATHDELESAALNRHVLGVLRTGVRAMKDVSLDPDEVAETMDDLQETMQDVSLTANLLTSTTAGDAADDELERELLDLSREGDDVDRLADRLPSPPRSKPHAEPADGARIVSFADVQVNEQELCKELESL